MVRFHDIAEEIEQRIRTGLYRPGDRIPSVRAFAREFGCSKLTVQRAFARLKRSGYLDNVVGSGSYVSFPERIEGGGAVYDLKTDYLAEAFFPVETVREIFSSLLRKTDSLGPTPVQGDAGFIRTLGEYYHVPTRQMIVISGAQQGLDLISKVFSASISDAMLFEDPTYPGAISLFRAKHFVPLEKDGPDLEILERALKKNIRLFYTMPSVHNPTGQSYSLEKKEAVAELVKQNDVTIIEDDYLSDYLPAASPRFIDIFPEKTIYIKSLSQTSISGFRLGFMVVPEAVYEKFRYTKYTSDIVSAGLLQRFFAEFIRRGAYGAFVEDTARRITRRRERLETLIRQYDDLALPEGQNGYNLWVRSENSGEVSNMPWVRGERFSFSPAFQNYFRISFMYLDDPTFDRALSYLKTLFDRICR